MRIPNSDDIKRLALQVTQPLSSGLFDVVSGFVSKLSDTSGFGGSDQFKHALPYGISSIPIKGVKAYFMNLGGSILAPIIIAHLDKNRPIPSAAGEVIFYCLAPDGSSVPIKMTLGVDGVLKIQASSKVQVICENVELGAGELEKVLNGETFQTFFNQHVHIGNLGVPTSPPKVLSEEAHLSTQVKISK